MKIEQHPRRPCSRAAWAKFGAESGMFLSPKLKNKITPTGMEAREIVIVADQLTSVVALGMLMGDPCQQFPHLPWHFLHGELDGPSSL